MPYNGTDITLITHKQASLKLAQINYFLMDISSFLHLSKTVWILGNPEENTGFISQPKSEILKYVSSLSQFTGVSYVIPLPENDLISLLQPYPVSLSRHIPVLTGDDMLLSSLDFSNNSSLLPDLDSSGAV